MTIRPVLRIALAAFLGTATLAAAETTYLPGAAEVTGLAGARFSSTLEVSNPGDTGTIVAIGLVAMAGKVAPAPVTRTLAAGESLRIPEALKTLFGLTGDAAGTLTVTSDEPLLANLSTRNVAAPEGAYGLGLLPVPASDLLGSGETGHSIWVSQSADPATGYRTNLSVTLADPGTVVEVRIFDAEGRVAGTVTVTAATPEVWQQPATALIGAGTDLPVGRAEFAVKAGRATAYAVVNDNVTSDAIALQAERVVPGASDRLISGAALSPGHLGSFWSTDLRLFNPGSAALDATIQSVGASRAASAVVPLPAKGVVEVARVLALLGLPEGTACALRVTGSDALLVAARTNNVDPAGVRKGTFSAQQFVTSWPSGLLGAGGVGFFNGIDQTLNVPGARTNLTIVGGPDGAAGELVLRDAAGVEHGRTGFLRGPGEWGQLGVADWFATAEGAGARVGGLAPATVPENARIDVSVATGALDAFVSRIDNGSGDAVTRPVAQPGGGDCSKVAVTAFGAAPQPVQPGVETTFSWTIDVDPPTAQLTSQSIRFDGEPEVELDEDVRSYSRSFASSGARSATLVIRKGSCVKTRALSFFVCGPLSLEPSALPDGVAFAVYPFRTLTAPGATAPTTFTIVAGALPEGLTLSAEGEISGSAEGAGLFAFTAKAVDANGCTGTRDYTIRVFCPTLRIAPPSLPAGTVAAPYPPVRLTVAGGSGAGTWSATGLPPGLALSTGGQLAGTPTAAGSYAVSVRFSDSSGCEGTATYTILVCNTLVVTPGTLPAGTAGSAYGPIGFTAAGATGGATWAVTSGVLPAGVTLDAGTGVLSGTPTVVGTFPFTVTATDTLGCSGSVAVTLVVSCPVITVNPAALAAAFEDTPYTVTLTQTGGNAGTTFSIASGTLPTGLTLNPATGVLAGAVAVPGDTTFTVRATDPVTACFGERTYTLTVTPVNDAPSFVKGPDVAILEDSGPYTAGWATAISAGPVDEAGQVLTFNVTGNTNPALFSVAPTVSPAGVIGFTPAANASGAATITLTLSDDGGTANGGVDTSAAQTFVITVTDVNDAPSFTKGPDLTVNEDSGAQTVNPWATGLSTGPAPEAGQALTFNVTGNTNTALFSTAPTVSPAGALSFTPAADANGTATITLTLSDDGGTASGGVDTSAAQTFVINVTAVNDAPSFTKGADVTVLEDSAAHTTATWATAILTGPADESAQTVSFAVTGNTNAALFAVAPAVSPAGALSFTPAANASGTATITLTLSDDGGTADGGIDTSAAQTFVINVTDVNDAPSFTKGADQTVLEDSGAQTVNPWATAISPGPGSESGQTVSFNVTGNTNAGLFSAGPSISPAGVLTYTPAANANGTATITLTISDNGGTADGGVNVSAAQTFVINVTAVNDVPAFTKGPDQTVFDNAPAQTVPGWATAISKGPADESGQTVTFNVTGNTNPSLFAAGPAVDATGTLTYTPTPSSGGTATITITLSDNGGTANGGVDTSAAQTFTITFNHVNVAPSFTKGADQAAFEDAGAQTVAGWATAISPGPPVESGQTVTFNVTGNTNAALFAAGPAISPTGVLTYTPAANANGTATITITLSDSGGTANGGADTSAPQTFVIAVTAVNDVPSFAKGSDVTVLEDSGAHTTATWATAILPGPADESGQTVSFGVTGNTNAALFTVAPAVSPTGVLTFTPAPNASGTATITLTLSDSGGTANGGVDTSAAQIFVVTVTDVNDAPSFTKGTDQAVLEDAGAQTVAGWATAISPGPPAESGQTVVFSVTNNTNAALFSAGPAISAAGVLTYTPALNANGTATITITLQDNGGTANGGIDTSPTQSFVISVTAVNDPPVATVRANLPAQAGIPITYPAGTLGGTDVANEVAAGSVVSIVTTPDTLCTGCQLTINADGSFVFTPPPFAAGTTVSFSYHVADTGFPGPGVSGAAATVSFAVAGPAIYFVKNPAVGSANCTLGNECSLTAALTAIGASTNARIFIGDASTHSPGVGVVLNSGGWIIGQGVPGASFDALFGISLPAQGVLATRPPINQARPTVSGAPATVTAHASSAIRGFNLNVSGGGNKGITANGRSGVVVSDVNVTSAAGDAIDLANTSASFDNIVVVATSGSGFKATGGGTVTVTGSASTITTTTGTALHVANTTIGAGNLVFRSISSNGGSSTGIILDTTGSGGGLKVTGTGSAGSGGTIANKTGTDGQTATGIGIFLNATSNVSLERMQLNGFGNFAIRGFDVAGLAMTNVVVSGTNGNSAAENEGSVVFGAEVGETGGARNGLTGTVTITSCEISGGHEDNLKIRNQSGTLTQLTMTSTTIRDNTTVSPGNNGVLFQADGTAVMNVDVVGGSFLRNRANGIQVITNGGGTMDFSTTGGTFTDNNIGVNAAHNSTGTFLFAIGNGTYSAPTKPGTASPINVNLASQATGAMTGTVSGNTITNANSTTGPGIRVTTNGSNGTALTIQVEGNDVSQIGNRGIEMINRDGNSVLNATVRSNTVTLTSPLAADGIRIDAGATSGPPADSGTVCADVAQNTSTTVGGVFGIRVRQRFSTTYRLESYGGSATDMTAVQTFLSNQNNSASVLADFAGSGFQNSGACPAP
ncbi:MAG: putative Ig domain-containing protein [Holophagales bacterium]|nr:putative Ig domain-containing protein [Holophagales bacterium]